MAFAQQKTAISPGEFLGFEVGEDRKLADWPQIAEYFHMLDDTSERVQTREIGKTTEGNPFLLVTISSPENLANLDKYRDIQARLADPRTIADEREAEGLIALGKAAVMVTCSIHATEVGAAQMSLLAGYRLATSDDESFASILDNVILLLVPCLNPDGLIMVKKWYEGTLGTKYEGANPPFLYHKYTGHDNNRDWFMFTQKETRLVVQHCLNKWHPQIVYDLHQTRTTGMRMILPPFIDPIGPNVDPVLQSELAMLGSAMASDLTAQGKAGVAVNVVYDAYSPSRSYQHYHGGIRLLSEAASARIATPVEIQKNQLKPARGENPLQASWNHPLPWKGGRWGLRDIVDYDFAAVMACLNNAARHKDTWVRNFYEVGKRAVTVESNPYAYLVPGEQRDPNTTAEMLDIMRTAGVEIHEATEPFVADGKTYPKNTRAILAKQPYWAFAKTMLEEQHYQDIRQYPGGPPKAPYDVTAHSLPIQMGVEAQEVKTPFVAKLRPLKDGVTPEGMVVNRRNTSPTTYLLRPETNANSRAVNRLLASEANVGRTQERFTIEGIDYPQGTFIIENPGDEMKTLVSSIAEEQLLTFDAVSELPTVDNHQLRLPRVGIYKSYVPTAEEGWTRFIFEDYGFAYTSLLDEDVKEGGLAERFDSILIPHQSVRHIHRGHDRSSYDPQYSGGLGEKGADNLRDFVQRGGTLIAWDGGARYAIQHLDLPVRNALAGLSHSDFFAPGSLLRVMLDTSHPIVYGMPEQAAAMFVNSPAFDGRKARVVGKYPQHNPLLSGWIVHPEKLYGKSALITVSLGKGEVVLMGFRVHFRAQARGTYKLLFNSLFYSAARR